MSMIDERKCVADFSRAEGERVAGKRERLTQPTTSPHVRFTSGGAIRLLVRSNVSTYSHLMSMF